MSQQKKRVLYIEDDPFFAKILSQKLTDSGYDALIATDGVHGLAQMRKTPCDLVLLDLLMPEMDGYEVLKQIRADKALKDVPIIVLSNVGAHEAVEKTKALGAIDFLVKALTTPASVVTVVDKALS